MMMEKTYKLIGKKGRTTIPYEVRTKMNIGYNTLVSYEIKDKDTLVIHREKICDKCSDKGVKEGSILDVVNSLSKTEQNHLLRYLTIRLTSGDHER